MAYPTSNETAARAIIDNKLGGSGGAGLSHTLRELELMKQVNELRNQLAKASASTLSPTSPLFGDQVLSGEHAVMYRAMLTGIVSKKIGADPSNVTIGFERGQNFETVAIIAIELGGGKFMGFREPLNKFPSDELLTQLMLVK